MISVSASGFYFLTEEDTVQYLLLTVVTHPSVEGECRAGGFGDIVTHETNGGGQGITGRSWAWIVKTC